jgi:DegV family protein with EDD domain
MSKIAVVTDSTAYIPENLSSGYPLHTVPLQVIWDEESYRDGIDIQPLEFYTRLQSAKAMPSTSQPSPAAFEALYRTLLDQDYHIVSIHISAKLSGTLDSAYQARDHLKSDRITIIDSNATSMALGFPVLMAARAVKEGASLGEVVALTEKAIENTGVMFVVSTLEFLHRGGRIGGAQAFLGTAFGLKPILELRDGRIEPIEKVRTMVKATDRMLQLLEERIGSRRPIHLAALHANAPTEAEALLQKACQRFEQAEITEAFSTTVSPAIGTHAGPGTVGICFLAGM